MEEKSTIHKTFIVTGVLLDGRRKNDFIVDTDDSVHLLIIANANYSVFARYHNSGIDIIRTPF